MTTIFGVSHMFCLMIQSMPIRRIKPGPTPTQGATDTKAGIPRDDKSNSNRPPMCTD